jgi:hypothetical protein
MIRRLLHSAAVVPMWFLVIGLAAAWVPTPSVPMALLLLALTVAIVPGLAIAGEERALAPATPSRYD